MPESLWTFYPAAALLPEDVLRHLDKYAVRLYATLWNVMHWENVDSVTVRDKYIARIAHLSETACSKATLCLIGAGLITVDAVGSLTGQSATKRYQIVESKD